AIDLREKQYETKMVSALDQIRSEIVNNVHQSHEGKSNQTFNLQQNAWQSFFGNLSTTSMIPVHIRYSNKEIENIIQQNLDQQGFDIPFDYAILISSPIIWHSWSFIRIITMPHIKIQPIINSLRHRSSLKIRR